MNFHVVNCTITKHKQHHKIHIQHRNMTKSSTSTTRNKSARANKGLPGAVVEPTPKKRKQRAPPASDEESYISDGEANRTTKKKSKKFRKVSGKLISSSKGTPDEVILRQKDNEIARLTDIIKVREKKLIELEDFQTEFAQKKRQVGADRWLKRSLMKADPAGQQVINKFVIEFVFKMVKILPDGFDVYSLEQNTFCGMIQSQIRHLPAGVSRRSYWYDCLLSAFVYKLQMVKNQKLQKMRTTVDGSLCCLYCHFSFHGAHVWSNMFYSICLFFIVQGYLKNHAMVRSCFASR